MAKPPVSSILKKKKFSLYFHIRSTLKLKHVSCTVLSRNHFSPEDWGLKTTKGFQSHWYTEKEKNSERSSRRWRWASYLQTRTFLNSCFPWIRYTITANTGLMSIHEHLHLFSFMLILLIHLCSFSDWKVKKADQFLTFYSEWKTHSFYKLSIHISKDFAGGNFQDCIRGSSWCVRWLRKQLPKIKHWTEKPNLLI